MIQWFIRHPIASKLINDVLVVGRPIKRQQHAKRDYSETPFKYFSDLYLL